MSLLRTKYLNIIYLKNFNKKKLANLKNIFFLYLKFSDFGTLQELFQLKCIAKKGLKRWN